jgi:hypothetical protein
MLASFPTSLATSVLSITRARSDAREVFGKRWKNLENAGGNVGTRPPGHSPGSQPARCRSVDRAIFALRNRIERFINCLKNSRRVASHYDHPPAAFSASPC